MKKILVKLLFLLLLSVFFICLKQASYAVSIDIANNEELKNVFINADIENGIIVLKDDVVLNSSLDFKGVDIEIDLNGHVINGTSKNLFNIENGSTLVISDSSGGKGEIKNSLNYTFYIFDGNVILNDGKYTSESNTLIYLINGELIINNGKFNANTIIKSNCSSDSNNKQKILINNGSFDATFDVINAFSGEITINNGEFVSYKRAIYMDTYDNETNLIINDGNFKSMAEPGVTSETFSPISINGGNAKINNGYFYSENGSAVFVQDAYNEHGIGNRVIIDGGDFLSKKECALKTAGDNSTDMELIINGGKFISESNFGIKIGSSYKEIVDENPIPEPRKGTYLYPTKGWKTKINGGEFIGYFGGLNADYSIKTLTKFIKGGIFIATSTNEEDFPSAIGGFAGLEEKHSVEELIADGYEMYDDNSTQFVDFGDNYVYSLTKATKVEVRKKKIKYKISYEIGNGIKITQQDTEIEEGSSKEFEIILEDGYELLRVMVNKKEVVVNKNKFSISDVKENIKIILETRKIKEQDNDNNNSNVDISTGDNER